MSETITPQEVLEAARAEASKAEKSREEAWAEKMFARGAEERKREEESAAERRAEDERILAEAEKEAAKEAEARMRMEARLEDGSVAQISPEVAGTEMAVKLEFRKAPEPGTLLYLEKPTVLTTPERGAAGFRKFWRAEEPLPGVKKEGETVYLRAEPVNPEEVESRKSEAADMREYLTDETLAQLKISRTESSPEALPLAA